MNADALGVRVRDFFASAAARYGLDREALTVEYVLNWGGFVNHSYRIRDGRLAFHLKLCTDPEDRDALARWQRLAPLLASHRAPPILDWIDLGEAAGLLFPFLSGSIPSLGDAVLAELVPALARLNGDEALGAALDAPAGPDARGAYRGSLHRRFTADLAAIRDAGPAFVPPPLLDWLEEEVERLAALIDATAAFAEPLTRAVHGDLWLNNVIWEGPGQWYLVDWDDVAIGDPAADVATLTGPTAADLTPLKLAERVAPILTPAERARLPLLGRATLLDWVIDPVADWIEAGVAPSLEAEVRVEKERVHRAALDLYRARYR